MRVNLRNDANLTKNVKIGFSWTMFFFGLFVPLIRGDLKWAVIIFVIDLMVGFFTFGIGVWVTSIIFSFIYNKIYVKELLEKGYRPSTEEDRQKLASAQVVAA